MLKLIHKQPIKNKSEEGGGCLNCLPAHSLFPSDVAYGKFLSELFAINCCFVYHAQRLLSKTQAQTGGIQFKSILSAAQVSMGKKVSAIY